MILVDTAKVSPKACAAVNAGCACTPEPIKPDILRPEYSEGLLPATRLT
jgi:hypothetical protein